MRKRSSEDLEEIKRPFKVLDGFPLSSSRPVYSKISHGLSIKDSAVLYSSLKQSREFWLTRMFKLYWSKQQDKLRHDQPAVNGKHRSNIREKMNKLCDCTIESGPHVFGVRLFILKNDMIEKKHGSLMEKKKQLKQQKKIAKEEDLQKKLEMRKVRDDHNLTMYGPGPGLSNNISLINNGYRPNFQQQQQNFQQQLRPMSSLMPNAGPIPVPVPQSSLGNGGPASGGVPVVSAAVTKPLSSLTKPLSSLTSQKSESEEKKSEEIEEKKSDESEEKKSEEIEEKKSDEGDEKKSEESEEQKSEESELKSELKSEKSEKREQASEQNTKDNQDTLQKQDVSKIKLITPNPTNTVPERPKPATDIMQSPENSIMIKNLNAIAGVDPYLDGLMKVVASGKSSPQQIHEFQGYIKKAREMGRRKIEDAGVFFQQLQQEIDAGVSNFPWTVQYQTIPVAGPTMMVSRQMTIAKSKKEKPAKEQKLTAFQERYLMDADLVFEYSEFPTERYRVPKEAIIEELEGGKFLISYIRIFDDASKALLAKLLAEEHETETGNHAPEAPVEKEAISEENPAAVDGQATENNDKSVVEVKQEEAVDNEMKTEDGVSKEGERNEEDPSKDADEKKAHKKPKRKPKRRFAPRKSKRISALEKKEVVQRPTESDDDEEEIEDEEDPDEISTPKIKYITNTLVMYDIPARFVQLIRNSFADQQQVYKKMEFIIKHGVKAPEYYMWYSVDGIQDEDLAEDLRKKLYETEEVKEKKKYNKRPTSFAIKAEMTEDLAKLGEIKLAL